MSRAFVTILWDVPCVSVAFPRVVVYMAMMAVVRHQVSFVIPTKAFDGSAVEGPMALPWVDHCCVMARQTLNQKP